MQSAAEKAGYILQIISIQLQKDEYRARDDRLLDANEFLEGNEKTVGLNHFKRFVIRGQVLDEEGSTFTILISLRGHLVKFIASKGSFVTSWDVFKAVNKLAASYTIESQTEALRYGPEGPQAYYPVLRPIDADPLARVVIASTRDGYWLADVLHHASDIGGFNMFGVHPRRFTRA